MSSVPSQAWFDMVIAVWLIIGLIRGRKHGMSEELLLVFKWLLIVVACAYVYRPLGTMINQATPMTLPWSYRTAYIGVALLIAWVMARIKSAVGEKLVGSDIFGAGEYYLGMGAGVVRFACMALVFLAVLNAHIPTQFEIDQVNTKTKDLGDVQVNPLKIEREVLLTTYTGKFVHEYLNDFMIQSTVMQPSKPRETIARKEQKLLDDIVDTSGNPAK